MIPKSIIKEVKQAWKEGRSEDYNFFPFRRRLKQLGYKPVRSAKGKGAYNVFLVTKDGYIVKNFDGFGGKKMPKMCVETYFIDKYHNIAIQPLVDTRSKKAKRLIEDFANNYNNYAEDHNFEDYDFHDKNLGLYKNKLVCFDW